MVAEVPTTYPSPTLSKCVGTDSFRGKEMLQIGRVFLATSMIPRILRDIVQHHIPDHRYAEGARLAVVGHAMRPAVSRGCTQHCKQRNCKSAHLSIGPGESYPVV
jgi:hypothetical protein